MQQIVCSQGPYLGLDVGGTAIKAGILDGARALARLEHPTPRAEGPDAVIAALVQIASQLAADAGLNLADLGGVGVGVPGRVAEGVVHGASNLPGWERVPLADRLGAALQLSVVVENDANAAAMGEYHHATRDEPGLRHMLMMTLGTGIGSGVVVDGQILRGASGWAGEIGHMIVKPDGEPCPCGQRGCLEQYASATAMARVYRQGGGDACTSRDICIRAADGEPLAREVFSQVAQTLACAILNVARVLDPQCVLLGGGLAAAGEPLLETIRQHLQRRTWSIDPALPRLALAQLGSDAGWRGAAALAYTRARTASPRIARAAEQ